MKAKNKKYVIAAIVVTLLLSLVLGAAILFPAPDQLTYLQKMINEKGYCKVSAGDMKFYIQADMAIIENDKLIIKKSAKTGDDSYVVIGSGPNALDSFNAKSVSIRFITTPKDMLEMTIIEGKNPRISFTAPLTFKIDRTSKWKLWLSNIREKIKKVMSKK